MISSIFKTLKIFAFLCLSTIFLLGCEALKPDWSEVAEPSGKKRARKNVEEGRGIGTGLFKPDKGTNFTFASSNPLWRASLDTLDFMLLSTVDYAGGLIISDWYYENDPDEAVKITIRFLDNEVRVDALNVIIHKKQCRNQKCTTEKIESDLSFEIKDKILRKAALLVKLDKEKRKSQNIKDPVFNERNNNN